MAIASIEKDGFEYSSDLVTWNWADQQAGWVYAWAQENDLYIGQYGTTEQMCHMVAKIGTLAINRGQTVNSALLKLNFRNIYKNAVFTIKAVLDSDGFGDPSGANLISGSGETLTTASVTVDTRSNPLTGSIPLDGTVNGTGNWNVLTNPFSINILPIVQEVVNNAAWPATAGGSIVLIFEWIDDAGITGNVSIWADEHATESAMEIDYDATIIPAVISVSGDDTITKSEGSVSVVTDNLTLPITDARIYKASRSVAMTITGTPTASAHDFTFAQGSHGYGSGYTYECRHDGNVVSKSSITLSPDAGKSYVIIGTPDFSDNSLCYNSSPEVKSGDIFEYDTTSNQGDTVTIDTTGKPSFTGTGTGSDTYECRYWSVETGLWGDPFTVYFEDVSYFVLNKIEALEPVPTLHAFTQSADGEIPTNLVTCQMHAFEAAALTNNPNLGFASVNSPSLKIIDATKTLRLYAYRDNTGEFQFLESGQPIDLYKATKIELKIGNLTFSDTDAQWSSKFTKSESGKLEVQLGELGLPPGNYKFYFILYSPLHSFGVVWNDKDQFSLELGLA